MFVDTHSHLNFQEFDKDRDEIIKRSLNKGVFMLNVGVDYQTSKKATQLAQEYPQAVFAAVGLHPANLANEKFNYEKYKALALSSGKVLAIGETGLDAMRPHQDQEKVLNEHLRLAQDLNLPIILHCRKAHQPLIKILEQWKSHSPDLLKRAVVHCFTGNWAEAQKYLALGMYLGFNGIIFKFDVEQVIKKMPFNRILLETDCPYLIPLMATTSVEGKNGRNEPMFVKYIAEKIAFIKNEPLEKIAQITSENACQLFNFQCF